MPKDYFQFKEFLINQDRSAFKVGTDGVLLGAWANVDGVGTILDIGTGTGLVALMLAQRSNARIVALEIDKASCEQAAENVMISPWKDRIQVINQSFQKYCTTGQGEIDLIVSNPPFFRNSLQPENHGKRISRHDTLLGIRDLVAGVATLLAKNGKFSVILPIEESRDMQQACMQFGLHLSRILGFSPISNSPVKRHILELRRSPSQEIETNEISIEKRARHDYTSAYRELTRDFYLAF